ncbi:MAG: restriction endonuclease [Rubrobacter sp.]|nr:restriction endonuclease [Rubrobacter sp.]
MPPYDQMMNPLLKALRSLGGSASIAELLEQVIEDEGFPPELVEVPHSDKSSDTELAYRLAWARTYLKKYGLVTNSERGVWALTPEGAGHGKVDPQEVARFVRRQSNRERENKPISIEATATDPVEAPEEADLWRESLMEALLEMAPDAFERLCQRVLRESGFTQVEVTGRSGDGGIDGNGLVRLAGLLSFPVVFQCKRYRITISSNIIRDFRGAMIGRADKGLIITTGSFTRDALLEATRDGAPPIDLIDGEQLMDRLKLLGLGIMTRQIEAVEVDTAWFKSI